MEVKYKYGDDLMWNTGHSVERCEYFGESIISGHARCLITTGELKNEIEPIRYECLLKYSSSTYELLKQMYDRV